MHNARLIIPPDEQERLQALDSYDIIDTDAEAEFDALTNLASFICKSPISLITLLDMNRQWFKSRVGLDVGETPREISFCQHAIMGTDLFEVQDALDDERFRDNPLVLQYPSIRFYAGYPLTTPGGYRLGTICVIDREPRQLSPDQKEALAILAQQVVAHFELRRQKKILEEDRNELQRMNRMLNDQNRLIHQQKDELNHLNYKLNHLIENVASDLRTPLGQISGMAKLVRMEGNLLPQQEEDISLLETIAIGMIERVDDILQVQTVHVGKFELHLEEIDILIPTEYVLRALEREARQKGITLGLRSGRIPGLIYIDRQVYAQYLSDVLSSAIEISPPGRHVELGLAEEGDRIRVEICCTYGMADEDLQILLDEVCSRAPGIAIRNSPLTALLVRARNYAESLAGEFHCRSSQGNIFFTAFFPVT